MRTIRFIPIPSGLRAILLFSIALFVIDTQSYGKGLKWPKIPVPPPVNKVIKKGERYVGVEATRLYREVIRPHADRIQQDAELFKTVKKTIAEWTNEYENGLITKDDLRNALPEYKKQVEELVARHDQNIETVRSETDQLKPSADPDLLKKLKEVEDDLDAASKTSEHVIAALNALKD